MTRREALEQVYREKGWVLSHFGDVVPIPGEIRRGNVADGKGEIPVRVIAEATHAEISEGRLAVATLRGEPVGAPLPGRYARVELPD